MNQFRKEEVARHLRKLAQDPRGEMARVPVKRDAAGRPLNHPLSAFSLDEIKDNQFVVLRDRVRSRLHGRIDGKSVLVEEMVPGRAPIADNDRPENLVNPLKYTKAADIDAAGLRKSRLQQSPWSGSYWPLYRGILGYRYADGDFPDSDDWKENHDYITKHPAHELVASGDASLIDRLSPSEKYDLLIGKPGAALTEVMWKAGKEYHDKDGKVERWMGICHGWAPAAYMLARPRRAVTVKAANGSDLQFYPADIKGLASLLWANTSPEVRFVGGRNNDKKPEMDDNGRLLASAAFDTNPGTWHLAITNQIGVAQRPFVMDTTYDHDVWNQPVVGYEYWYFNPRAMKWAPSLAAASVPRGQFSGDRFARYRSNGAVAIAGVAMRTHYIRETRPVQRKTDGPEDDLVTTVDYYYDLELDENGNVLGGEWYTNRHPDFLWTPTPGARAETSAEGLATGPWSGGETLPESWREAAARAAGDGLPLAKIVEQLIALSGA